MKNYTGVKRNIFVIIIFFMTTFLTFGFFAFVNNPLRKPPYEIREQILSIIPLGTSMDNAIELIEAENWVIRYVSNNGVGRDNEGIPSEPGANDVSVVGRKSIRVHMGDYGFPFVTSVVAYFSFDEELCLVGVYVRKDVDSL